jgi:hypothetical protein
VSSSAEQQKLEKQLNEYVRLYADSQAENEKLRLDVRRLEQTIETEKVFHKQCHCECISLDSF